MCQYLGSLENSFSFLPVTPPTFICCSPSQQHLICWHPSLCGTTIPPIWLGTFMRINYATSLIKQSSIIIDRIFLCMWYSNIALLNSFMAMIWWSITYSKTPSVHLYIHSRTALYLINIHDLLVLSMDMPASDVSFLCDSFHRYSMTWYLVIFS